MEHIRTRFPPSPTGYLHIGGARTALFNWLYARHVKGSFILRIEDTDVERSTQASVDAILKSLEWLEIDWDEGPFFQSQRLHIYKEYIQKLLDSGNAYYCTCSPETLEANRKAAMAAGFKPKYDGTCRDKGLPKSDNAVIRFRSPQSGITVLKDAIKGNIAFENDELDDFIIQRTNGMPTYNFVVVVDDITMKINTVIRGDDHVNNTPRQILLYKALGVPLPTFGHVPMVLGTDRTRLSKRHGAMSVTEYRDMGFLPDALINYLVRLGWSFGDQEFFNRNELIEKFSLENIGHSAGVFNPDKLLSLNADHIKASSTEKIGSYLVPLLKDRGAQAENDEYLSQAVQTLKVRAKTLKDMADGCLFYYQDKIIYEEKAAKKFLKTSALDILEELILKFDALESFDQSGLEGVFKELMNKTKLKLGKIAQPVRVALTGKTVSPGIFEIIEVLGKDRVMTRLRDAAEFIQSRES
ncbi:Glutamate--tRNA ligase [Candidatus Magnetomoraceae bacterium gMMP-15]